MHRAGDVEIVDPDSYRKAISDGVAIRCGDVLTWLNDDHPAEILALARLALQGFLYCMNLHMINLT